MFYNVLFIPTSTHSLPSSSTVSQVTWQVKGERQQTAYSQQTTELWCSCKVHHTYSYSQTDANKYRTTVKTDVLSWWPYYLVVSLHCQLPLCAAVFVNRDRLTGFGTPWEIRFEGNYTILRKGGNVDGYSALFSFVPELQLGRLASRTCETVLNV